jgi:hypothetical protein
MSVQRRFAQRNNNVVDLVPVKDASGNWSSRTYLLKIDPRNCSTFNVDLRELEYLERNIYNRCTAYGDIDDYNDCPVIYFAVIVDPAIAVTYPGLEYTINFNGYDDVNWNTCVNVFYNATLTGDSEADIMSPVGGFDYRHTQSITMKSNGIKFTVLAAGPFTWYSGYVAFD